MGTAVLEENRKYPKRLENENWVKPARQKRGKLPPNNLLQEHDSHINIQRQVNNHKINLLSSHKRPIYTPNVQFVLRHKHTCSSSFP